MPKGQQQVMTFQRQMTQSVRAAKVGGTRQKKAFPDASCVRGKRQGGGGAGCKEREGRGGTGKQSRAGMRRLDAEHAPAAFLSRHPETRPLQATGWRAEPAQRGHLRTPGPGPSESSARPLLSSLNAQRKTRIPSPPGLGRSFTGRVDIKTLTEEQLRGNGTQREKEKDL